MSTSPQKTAQRTERALSTLGLVALNGIQTSITFTIISNRDTCVHTFLRRNN